MWWDAAMWLAHKIFVFTVSWLGVLKVDGHNLNSIVGPKMISNLSIRSIKFYPGGKKCVKLSKPSKPKILHTVNICVCSILWAWVTIVHPRTAPMNKKFQLCIWRYPISLAVMHHLTQKGPNLELISKNSWKWATGYYKEYHQSQAQVKVKFVYKSLVLDFNT